MAMRIDANVGVSMMSVVPIVLMMLVDYPTKVACSKIHAPVAVKTPRLTPPRERHRMGPQRSYHPTDRRDGIETWQRCQLLARQPTCYDLMYVYAVIQPALGMDY